MQTTSNSLPPQEFRTELEKGNALLVDVRTPQEFASGHIPGSVNIDWTAKDYEQRFLALEKDKPLLLYCAAGGRSDQAREFLSGHGYLARDLEDGINAWKEAGYPLEK